MTATGRKLPLKNLFSKFSFDPTKKVADQIIRWKSIYEAEYHEAFNTALLGCFKLGFFPKHSQVLFDVLGVDRADMERTIRQSSIPASFHVVSDAFNLLTVWAAYQFVNSTLPKATKDLVVKSLFFMLLAKFFSSLTKHYYKYTPNRGTMEATIDSLSDKFDIRQKETSTWKLIIEKRTDELVQPEGIHSNVLKTFVPDQKIIYLISDLQTRLRTKVRIISSIYYEMVEAGKEIRESGMVTNDAEGKKIIKELNNSFEGMIASICNRVLNTQQFIKADYITIVSKLVPNIRTDMMRNMLMQFSARATVQYQKKQSDVMSKDGKLFEGYHILLQNMIQRFYRDAVVKKINLNSRLEILKNSMNLVRSSRLDDPIIEQIKNSLDKFVVGTRLSVRESTNASLRIAFVTYIILMSFDCD